MDNSRPLQSIDPRPISSTPGDQAYQPPMAGTMSGTMPQFMPDTLPHHPSPYDVSSNFGQSHPPPGMGLHHGPEAHIPARPVPPPPPTTMAPSTHDVPRPPTQTFTGQQVVNASPASQDLRNVRANCLFQLKEYMVLQNKTKTANVADIGVAQLDLQNQVRNQSDMAILELKRLQAALREVTREGEEHRWRRWLVGGAIASFIPLVRRIFRRGDDEESRLSANDTEYAWHRATNLLRRIKDSIIGRGGLASIAFFVFAVLYVFKNEVKLRVAKTIRRRVRKLCARMEAGDEMIGDDDLKIFDGWRWKIVD